jgi:hypothetical protein
MDSKCYVNAAEKDGGTKHTWASVAGNTVATWPPKASSRQLESEGGRELQATTSDSPSLYDEQALIKCYNNLVLQKQGESDPLEGVPRGWFELYYACNCQGKARCDVPVNFLNFADGTEDVFNRNAPAG